MEMFIGSSVIIYWIIGIILPMVFFIGILVICSRLRQICNILNELLDKTNNIDVRLENLRTKSNENMNALLKLELIKNKDKQN